MKDPVRLSSIIDSVNDQTIDAAIKLGLHEVIEHYKATKTKAIFDVQLGELKPASIHPADTMELILIGMQKMFEKEK